MKNIEKILSQLNIQDLYKSNSFTVPVQKFDSKSYSEVSSKIVHFNESLITIQGNVTSDVIPELKDMIKRAEKEITRNIIKSM